MKGDDADRIKKTLNGDGHFRFEDGAVVGVDIAGMVRNTKAAFGLGRKPAQKPRTDFSEFFSKFTITNGLLDTRETGLQSPLLRVSATGKANLVKETLDFRVEPKAVGTIKGQGDTKNRRGIMVPVLITGTFTSPEFRPDLKGVFEKGLESEELKDLMGDSKQREEKSKELEDKAKGLLKGLPTGR
jgi:AsmA protein